MPWWERKGERIKSDPAEERRVKTEGVYERKCPKCDAALFKRDLEESSYVCPNCDHHFRLGARQRLAMLFDEGNYEELDAEVVSHDPLEFVDTKPYKIRLEQARRNTGLPEAVVEIRFQASQHRDWSPSPWSCPRARRRAAGGAAPWQNSLTSRARAGSVASMLRRNTPRLDTRGVTDFRVQRFRGQPVLTWWRGSAHHGPGTGGYTIADTSYRTIATTHPGHGLVGLDDRFHDRFAQRRRIDQRAGRILRHIERADDALEIVPVPDRHIEQRTLRTEHLFDQVNQR